MSIKTCLMAGKVDAFFYNAATCFGLECEIATDDQNLPIKDLIVGRGLVNM